MNSFSWPLANGRYHVKLHFAETAGTVKRSGQRVFSFAVQSREFKDFDIWAKAGGENLACVEKTDVDVRDGRLLITFTREVGDPQINGIEILP